MHGQCLVASAHWFHDWQVFNADAWRMDTLRCRGVVTSPVGPGRAVEVCDTFDGDFQFYAGSPEPSWLWNHPGPWFVSDTRLRRLKTFRPVRAGGHWALDSGGFTQLQKYGRWTFTPQEYAARVRRYHDEIGGMDSAHTMDWMCEDAVRLGGTSNGVAFAGTGLSVVEHQARTVGSYLDLMAIDPGLPWRAAVQGKRVRDYVAIVERYLRAGVDLTQLRPVGLGSVCRRQDAQEIADIVGVLSDMGLAMHGFGVKTKGLPRYGRLLASADSMSWSEEARKQHIRLPGCTHDTCNYCPVWAQRWRARLLDKLALPRTWNEEDEDTERSFVTG